MKFILSQLTLPTCTIVLLAFFTSCKSDDDSPILITDPVELTENIEVYNADLIDNGYVFGMINGGNESFLLDKTGNKIKVWNFEQNLGNDIEILPSGQLLGLFKSSNIQLSIGGAAGIVRLMDSEGATQWEFEYNTTEHIIHHDAELLPNGNVLLMVYERVTLAEAQLMGSTSTVDIFPEALIEVDPSTDTIVWEWHSKNHMIQEDVPAATNFGVVSDNPQLINLNYNNREDGDIMHGNGFDYDETKDVIYFSINFYSEVWVIDHSTTTAQAATNNGGNYNKGGNLLYRFGNPETYNNTAGQRLFYNNHFPNLLEGDEPGAGNVLVYNNGSNIQQSTVMELQMPEPFNLVANADNEPNIIWSFTDPSLFYSRISGAVRLPNGNTLICEGDFGYWEVTEAGEVVWKYNGLGPNFWRGYSYPINSEAIISLNL